MSRKTRFSRLPVARLTTSRRALSRGSAGVFETVNWVAWLALMLPYSCAYLLIDTAVLWRVINWFNTRVDYRHLLPVRH